MAFRVITANHAPDHATIARFRVRHEAAIAELFSEVLGLCARSGLRGQEQERSRRQCSSRLAATLRLACERLLLCAEGVAQTVVLSGGFKTIR